MNDNDFIKSLKDAIARDLGHVVPPTPFWTSVDNYEFFESVFNPWKHG